MKWLSQRYHQNKNFIFFVYTFIIFNSLFGCSKIKINEGSQIFLPKEIGLKLQEIQSFPGSWWNYLVVEEPQPELCKFLKSNSLIKQAQCQYAVNDIQNIGSAWISDLPLRTPAPSSEQFHQALSQSLAKATSPIGGEVIELLRNDPLSSYLDLLELTKKLQPSNLDYTGEYWKIRDSNLYSIPILLNFSSSEIQQTEKLIDEIKTNCTSNCDKIYFIGPHFASAKNKGQVMRDVSSVSIRGTLCFAIFLAFLVFYKRHSSLLVVPPIIISVGIAVLLVNWIYGSIHGLTLAFGSGMVGIAFDYAFHGFVKNMGTGTWRANLVGYLTTAVILLVIACSNIPLVRELMVFSLVGISSAFLLVFLELKFIPHKYFIEPFNISPKPNKWAIPIAIASLATIVASFFLISPQFNLKQMDFKSSEEDRVTKALFSQPTSQPMLIIHSAEQKENFENELEREQKLSKESSILLVNQRTFFPSISKQEQNLESWKKFSCGPILKSLTHTQRVFFSPFLEHVNCTRLNEIQIIQERVPLYAQPIAANGKWLSTFFPKNTQEEHLIAKHFSANSLKSIIEEFPKILIGQILWMAPLSFFFVVLILFFNYRNWRYVFSALIPFFIGAAWVGGSTLLFHLPFGFISFLGLLMVYGFSIDYGVFATNHFIQNKDLNSHGITQTGGGVWTALFLAAVPNIVGFFPLLFAEHPVLRQIGEPLFYGTLGTIVGTYFVIPHWMKLRMKNENNT